MEIFRRALETALAHEKSKTAIRTRKTYKKQISVLEKTIVDLKSIIVTKDSDIAGMGKTIDNLHAHLGSKKSEIEGLEGELHEVKSALEDKDKMHSQVLQKLNVQSNLFTTTRKHLEHITRENEDQSNQIWKMLEENCFLNKRILELDLEVQSLETLLFHMKTDLEKAEQRANLLGQNLRHSQEGYELKSREVIDISVREKQLLSTVINLQCHIDQLKRDSRWMLSQTSVHKKTSSNSSAKITHTIQFPVSPTPERTTVFSSFRSEGPHPYSLPSLPVVPPTFANLQENLVATSDSLSTPAPCISPSPSIPPSLISPSSSTSGSPSISPSPSTSGSPSISPSPSVSPSLSPSISPTVSPPRSPPASPTRKVQLGSSPAHTLSPLLTPFTPSLLSYFNGSSGSFPSTVSTSPPIPSSNHSTNSLSPPPTTPTPPTHSTVPPYPPSRDH
eukprot:Phypoly_transcript_08227.p1 GENE.Phypoly_transcript_08227~~Phypoly_transcript_08227.p1  ORF type:complete len:470 (+),score=83.09 Phypoly_transcript_08227:70-1410(+)